MGLQYSTGPNFFRRPYDENKQEFCKSCRKVNVTTQLRSFTIPNSCHNGVQYFLKEHFYLLTVKDQIDTGQLCKAISSFLKIRQKHQI